MAIEYEWVITVISLLEEPSAKKLTGALLCLY